MIQIQNLTKTFTKNVVLNHININLDQPGVTAILGPNGSGKTTLIKCILGMVIPQKGTITFNGEDVRGKWKYREHIAYLPQIARFPENLTVAEVLEMVKKLRTQSTRDKQLIEYFELTPFLFKRLSHLSGGTRQKVNLVLALMYDTPVLFMDEPTAGLDPVALIKLKELIQELKTQGKRIMITTHIMSFVEEMADQIVFLLEGNIHFNGTLKTLKETYRESQLENAIAQILTRNKNNQSANKINIQSPLIFQS